jgi:prepilin-type N-terminal cleavage/methylation domain-containing protein
MKKAQLHINNFCKGFSLVEVLLASSIFAIIVTALVGAYLYGIESTAVSGNRARAVLIAEEGLEAVRNIRDNDFEDLVVGTYGIEVLGGEWDFYGSSDDTDIFTRKVSIGTISDDQKLITSTVTWQQNLQRTGTVSVIGYLNNWARIVFESEGFLVNTNGASIGGGGNFELQGLTIDNTGLTDITITNMEIEWDNGNLIEEIEIDNTRIWKHDNEGLPDSKESSVADIDNEDTIILAGAVDVPIDKLKFDGDMTGTIFSIIFTLGDGSSKSTVSFTP